MRRRFARWLRWVAARLDPPPFMVWAPANWPLESVTTTNADSAASINITYTEGSQHG